MPSSVMASIADSGLVTALGRLGFSDMEAAIYVDLLKHPGSTGYRIGKSIKKPHANVYQALGGLEQSGAVILEEGESRTYHAVLPDEMLDRLRRRYEQKCREAENALKTLEVRIPDEDHFFRLVDRDQVYARARGMLRGATTTVLVEAFPSCAEQLKDDIEETAARGIAVAGMVLRKEDLMAGTELIVSEAAERVAASWTGDQLILIVDAREFLLALFDRETGEVIRGVWVSSPYVAAILNNGVASDVILHGLPSMKDLGSPTKRLFGRLPAAIEDLLGSPREPAPEAAPARTSRT